MQQIPVRMLHATKSPQNPRFLLFFQRPLGSPLRSVQLADTFHSWGPTGPVLPARAMSPLVVLVVTIEERPHFPRLDQRHWQEIAGRMQTGDQKSHTPYPLAGWAPDISRRGCWGWCYSASPTWMMPGASILQPNRSTTPSFDSSPENAATAAREKHAARGIHFEGDMMAGCNIGNVWLWLCFFDVNIMYIYI